MLARATRRRDAAHSWRRQRRRHRGDDAGKLAGLRVIVTAGSDEKCERCLAHGADVAINYNEEDFVERARGANVILDHIGARYLPRDLEASRSAAAS